MRRHTTMTVTLMLLGAVHLHAGTFDRTPIAPERGLDVLNRNVARDVVGRDLFASPYATVTISNVDVYDVFPYVEARRFQIVSDPAWNRLVFGEAGRSLHAWNGAGSVVGPLSNPRGLAVDDANRVYVADAGNDRVLVLQAVTEFDDIQLVPLYEIGGLASPFDVALSDGATPFDTADDVLYVANSGANQIVAFLLDATAARRVAEIGELGNGPGRFAGPLAVTVGRADGRSTPDVFVADAHTRRIVHLRHEGGGFQWVSELRHDADVVTSLDTDHWGNVYAAAPNRGVVRKYTPDMQPIAETGVQMLRPRSFHVPFNTVRDHRAGTVRRLGQPNGLLVEQWDQAHGIRHWDLGVEIADMQWVDADLHTVQFTLTDHANVSLEIADAATGHTLVTRSAGTFDAGSHAVTLSENDLRGAAGAGDVVLRIHALAGYEGGASATATLPLALDGTVHMAPPTHAVLLGNSPNPFMPSTRIAFLLPDADHSGTSLRIFDAQGRVVRTLDHEFVSGLNQVIWDGSSDDGHKVPAGVYFYHLDTARESLSNKMVYVR